MDDGKRVKDIMAHIDEYDKVDAETPLWAVMSILRENHERIKAGISGTFHKTLFVTDESQQVIGKLSVYDLLRGLVPEAAKKPEFSRGYYRALSSRAMEVAEEVGGFQEQFKWLHSTFSDLVKEEGQKPVKEIMSPIHPILAEEDPINKAIYVMFKENIRQPLVVRHGKIVGVVSIMAIFPEILDIAGDRSLST